MLIDPRLSFVIQNQPYPLLFATISGAHLYGFPSPDSDYDLRGVHLLPIKEVIGLFPPQETIEFFQNKDNLIIDLVTHDVKFFFSLLLKRNGYVLEQLYSPLIIQTTPEHQELKAIASECITRHHTFHYLGLAKSQWGLFEKEQPPRLKPLLYVYRSLLTGIYLMQTGKIEANLTQLNQVFQLPYIAELITLKQTGEEKSTLTEINLSFYQQEYARLRNELELAYNQTQLRDQPNKEVKEKLNDLLIRLREQGTGNGEQ